MNRKKILTVLLISILCMSPLFVLTHNPTASQDSTSTMGFLNEQVQPQQNQEYETGGTIKTYMGDTANTLNPLNIISVYDDDVISRLFDGLAYRNPYQPANLQAETGVMAKSFNYTMLNATDEDSDSVYNTGGGGNLSRINGTTVHDANVSKWTVELRDNYKWHDGKDITADDLVFTYQFDKWIINYATSESMGDFMPEMQYYRVEKLDTYTVNIYSGNIGFEKKRYPLYLTPWPQHIYGDASTWEDGATGTFYTNDTWKQPGWDITPQQIVNYVPTSYQDEMLTGSGAWILDYADAKAPEDIRTFLFKRNQYYPWSPYNENGTIMDSREWKPEYFNNPGEYNTTIWPSCQGQEAKGYMYGPYAERLKMRVILKESFEWEAFKNGEIDFAVGASITQHSQEISQMGFNTYENPEWGVGSIHFQCNKTYFTKQPEFRRAVDWAIDKNELINELANGYGIPVDDFLTETPYGPWNWETPADRFAASPGKARDLVEGLDKVQADSNDDGFVEYAKNGSNIRPLKMLYRSGSPRSEQEAHMLEGYIEDAGIPVKIVKVTWDEIIEAITTGGFQTALHGWVTGAIPSFVIWACEVASWSYDEYHWVNHSYTKAYLEYSNALKVEKAYEGAHKCEQIMYEQVPAAHTMRDLVVSSYREDKWQGAIPGVSGSMVGYWSYQFMTLTGDGYTFGGSEQGEEEVQGFTLSQGATVSGTTKFGASVSEFVSGTVATKNVTETGSKLEISYAGAQIDTGETEPVDINLTAVSYAEEGSAAFTFAWEYEVDTTTLSNGNHLFKLYVYGILEDRVLTYTLLFNVDNPVPLTQQLVPMLTISSIVGLIIGAAVVFAVMRRKKPPEE